MIRVKDGVRVVGVKPELLFGLMVAEGVYRKHGKDLWVTELTTERNWASYHNGGYAADLRIYFFDSQEEIEEVVEEIRRNLTSEYDVVLEDDHIHLEFDVRKAGGKV